MKTYALGIFLALAGGWVQIRIHDLLFTALLVLVSAMLLGALKPARPWGWAILFLIIVPLMQILAPLLAIEKPTRAETFESILVFLPAIVGAYGGATLKRVVHTLRSGQ